MRSAASRKKGLRDFAPRAAGVEVGLEAVAQRPLLGEQLEARLGDRLDRPGDLRLGAADLRQHDDDAPLGAALGELARQRQGRAQIVARSAGRQEHHVALLGQLLGQVVGEAAACRRRRSRSVRRSCAASSGS